ncbi:MAG: PD-(D/E)XK nuclease family transposase [Treponema sp.]|nr:Rpn family recombination-promoting nuclease/putative transposase [Spirochaetia bacterium]MDD7458624.1 PD-(D/E)XK nuclease family transposase [Spirochaetales bacterium]MDY5810712.1 PD-(D/E)XK nuclease family transposase [Treponema sp.]
MTTQTQPNVIYKDRLFKAIFGKEEHKDWLLSLYNALNDSDYKNPNDLELTTIENIIYITMKNDLSFLIDSQMNLYEQQSTWNPNMPLRGLFYFAQLYQQHISKQKRDIYSSTLLKIPTPQFIVIYNGSRQTEDIEKLKLSDAFEVPKNDGEFEWTATLVNINKGHNEQLLAKCKPLNDYATYIERIKANIKQGLSKKEAVDEAMEFAIKSNMLNGFFLFLLAHSSFANAKLAAKVTRTGYY